MREMKYVVTKTKDGPEQIFIFEKDIDHDRFYEVLSYIKEGHDRDWKREFRELISAGFTDGKTCWGKSESLNKDSRPKEDTALLETPGKERQKYPLVTWFTFNMIKKSSKPKLRISANTSLSRCRTSKTEWSYLYLMSLPKRMYRTILLSR